MRRSKVEIIADILKSTNGTGATKTQIVYRANLNFKLATIYLQQLLENGYITEVSEGGRKKYLVTSKGMEFLNKLYELSRELEDLFLV